MCASELQREGQPRQRHTHYEATFFPTRKKMLLHFGCLLVVQIKYRFLFKKTSIFLDNSTREIRFSLTFVEFNALLKSKVNPAAQVTKKFRNLLISLFLSRFQNTIGWDGFSSQLSQMVFTTLQTCCLSFRHWTAGVWATRIVDADWRFLRVTQNWRWPGSTRLARLASRAVVLIVALKLCLEIEND